MRLNLVFILSFILTTISCSADEPTVKVDMWGDKIPEVLTYDYVIQQYIKAGYMIDSLANERHDTYASPQDALNALYADIANGDSIWVADRISKGSDRVPISYVSKIGLFYCSFEYRIIEVFFTLNGSVIENVHAGINDITPGDVEYTKPDIRVDQDDRHPVVTVFFQANKKATIGGVTVYSQPRSFNYRFTIDLKSMTAVTF